MHEELAAALGVVMGVVNMAFFSLAGASLVLARPHAITCGRRCPGPGTVSNLRAGRRHCRHCSSSRGTSPSSHVCCL